jgi:hypothetical protein
MNYIITGNDVEGYVLTNVIKPIRYTTCPCCDKPIRTRRAAEILAQNLTLLDEKVDNLKNGG